MRSSTSLHCILQPFPANLFPIIHCLSTLCVSPRVSNASSALEYLFYTLNLVLQVTISLGVSSAMFFLAVIPYFYCFSLTPLCSLLSFRPTLPFYFSAYVSFHIFVCFHLSPVLYFSSRLVHPLSYFNTLFLLPILDSLPPFFIM